jgi:type 1 glutamine amidotransferase
VLSQKIRTLIITGQTDIHHNWQATTPAIKNILEESGRFAVEVTTSYKSEMAKTLQTDFDLIVLNYYGRHEPWGKIPEQLFEPEAEQALYDFVESGKGFIG